MAALLTLSPASRATAQLGSYNPPPGQQGTFAIRNAKIFPVSGPEITSGTVVISGGKIQAVGASVAVPAGAQVIDGTGLSIYPGMMDAGTSLGLSEIPQGAPATVDIAEASGFTLYGAARTGEVIGGEGAVPVSRLPRRMGLGLV